MDITYGSGEYITSHQRLKGEIILSDHKLFLRNAGEDLTATYVPLEKIIRLRRQGAFVKLDVRPSLTMIYEAAFSGERRRIQMLVDELVQRRQLKKRFLRNEWFDPDSSTMM